MTEKSKLTKSGINALTSPFRWILITAIVYFLPLVQCTALFQLP